MWCGVQCGVCAVWQSVVVHCGVLQYAVCMQCAVRVVCVWCVVCGVWCVVCAMCDVWCAMCGVQCAVMCCYVCVFFSEHTIEWKDGRSENWSVNLMTCRKIKEWRFWQPSEDVDEFLK